MHFQVKQFINILQKQAEKETISLFTTEDLKRLAEQAGLHGHYDIINALNLQGYLLQKGNNLYQLQSVDF